MIETKLFNLSEVKFAASEDDTKLGFTGYGARFNNVDSYGDVIVKGAFAAAIKSGSKPLMLLNHDFRQLPIGVWDALEEDDDGLKMSGRFIDTALGRDAYTCAKTGAITGLSIGFRITDFDAAGNEDGFKRRIKSVELLEVSLVTFPANDEARVESVKTDITKTQEFADAVAHAVSALEAKYAEAEAFNQAANQLLSKLLGDK